MMKNIRPIADKILSLLNSDIELEAIYHLLKQIGPIQEKLYQKHKGPTIIMKVDGWGDWHLWTTIPDVDYTHEARWNPKTGLSDDEQVEIRKHLSIIVQIWINHDSLYSTPMAKQDAAKLMGIEVKTLNRHIKSGLISAIELNKNIIRILESDIKK